MTTGQSSPNTVQPNPPANQSNRRIPGLPKNWENFILSIVCVLILPLIPIIYEYIRGRHIGTADLMLTASMYAIGVGISSTSRLTFISTIIIGIIHAASYGEFKNIQNASTESEIIAYIAIAFVFLIHSVERYNLHVVEQKSWEFPAA
jgi:hypothetical protein